MLERDVLWVGASLFILVRSLESDHMHAPNLIRTVQGWLSEGRPRNSCRVLPSKLAVRRPTFRIFDYPARIVILHQPREIKSQFFAN